MIRLFLLAACMMLAIGGDLHAQQIRKWNDNGRIVYADTSPSPGAREIGTVAVAKADAPASAGTGAKSTPNQAGVVEFFDGKVTIQRANGSQAAARVGQGVLEGDTISTAGDGAMHIDMTDGGVLAIKPNSSIRITQYQARGDANDRSYLNIFKGGLRSITGWIGKTQPANYKIMTPSATIGVRGTDHETHVVLPGSSDGEPGTYEKVHAGESVLKGAQGTLSVKPGATPGFLSHAGREAPRLFASAPAFLRAGRHDVRLEGRHEKVLRSFEQRREQRRQQLREAIQRRREAGPATDKAAARAARQERREERREERASHPHRALEARHEAMQGNHAASRH
jgi:hypothetical protein